MSEEYQRAMSTSWAAACPTPGRTSGGDQYERRAQVEDYLKMTDSRPPAPGGGAYDSLDAAAAALRECPYMHTNIDGARQPRPPCAAPPARHSAAPRTALRLL